MDELRVRRRWMEKQTLEGRAWHTTGHTTRVAAKNPPMAPKEVLAARKKVHVTKQAKKWDEKSKARTSRGGQKQ